jgi:hypothetical protein
VSSWGSALAEVEGGGASGAEVDGDRLGVVGVDVEAGGGQHGVEGDRAAEGVAQGATTKDAVGVELEGGAILLALQDVLDHAVGEGGVLVGHVDRGGAGAIAEAADVGAEGHVLSGGLANGGDVDLSAADLEAPVADLADDSEVGVGDLELVRGSDGAVISDVDGGAAGSGGHLQDAGGGGVGDHEVGGAGGDTSGQGAGTGAAGLAVDHAELDGVADTEVQKRLDNDFVAADGDVGFTEGAGGASGFVVESAGRAGQDSGGHGAYQEGLRGGHCPAYYRLAFICDCY